MKNIFTRREALAGLAAAGAGLALSPFPSYANNDLKMILERKIPSTGERLPVVGLGSWQQFDVGAGAAERSPLKEVLQKMQELGGRLIDASPMSGRAELVIGDLTT